MVKGAVSLLEFLDNNGIDIFEKSYVVKNNFSDKSLRELVDKDYFRIIERGKYCRHNFSDEYVIGSFLVKTGGIAYWTAMNYHGLTEQIPNVVYVQTTQAKKNKTIFGVRYKFIRVKERKLIGFKKEGYGNHQFFIMDVEKTIVDCFDLPEYSGGYAEIIKAFNQAKLSAQKLVKYCTAIDNIAVTKRLGYLCELVEKPKMDYFIKYAQSVRNEKYNLFEGAGEKHGKTNRRWRLVMNMDEEEILEIANS